MLCFLHRTKVQILYFLTPAYFHHNFAIYNKCRICFKYFPFACLFYVLTGFHSKKTQTTELYLKKKLYSLQKHVLFVIHNFVNEFIKKKHKIEQQTTQNC